MTITKIGTFLMVLAFLFSCQKYEEGPAMTFRSPDKNIKRSWGYFAAYRNGLNITCGQGSNTLNYGLSSIGFADNNRFSISERVIGDSTFYVNRYDGDWEFRNDKQEIALIFGEAPPEFHDTVQVWEIIKLTKDELKVQETVGDNTIEYILKPNG